MATFLELVQDVARESGTEPNINDPSTLTGVTGRLLRMKHMVEDSWRDIQRLHKSWLWMYATFSGTTIASTQDYDAAAMGITASRFSRWVIHDEQGELTMTSYLTSAGRSEERLLAYVEWPEFYRRYLRGDAATTTGEPQVVTVDPQRKLHFYPIPDASYTIRGRYYKAPQVLSVDADEPECPAEYHDTIKWKALSQLAVFDENSEQLPMWQNNYFGELSNLRSGQLALMNTAGPLA